MNSSCPYCNAKIEESLQEHWHGNKGPALFKIRCPVCGEIMDAVAEGQPSFLTLRELEQGEKATKKASNRADDTLLLA